MKRIFFLMLIAMSFLWTPVAQASSEGAITVRLNSEGVSSWQTVNLYAWTTSTQILGSWPGTKLTQDADGWYSYTFADSITSVNIIWNNGSAQTKDITNVTESTCYSLKAQSGNNIDVTTIMDCPSGPVVYYTVNFLDWDATLLKTEQVQRGHTATPPTNPTREGYYFSGWDKNFSKVQSDLDVTAQYSLAPIDYYTVNFYSWDSTLLKTEQVPEGKSATAPIPPLREGYTFRGWSTSFTQVWWDTDVYALYRQNKYTVCFCDWQGNIISTQSVLHGDSATAPGNVQYKIRRGFEFTGWDKDFSNIQSDMVIKPCFDLALYPRADYWYDFDRGGEKGIVIIPGSSDYYYYSVDHPYYTAGVSKRFEAIDTIPTLITDLDVLRFCYAEDVNRDGVVDYCVEHDNNLFKGSGYYGSFISHGEGYVFDEKALIIPNLDVNKDGRIDYLSLKNNNWYVMLQQADGTFNEQFMRLMTKEEAEAVYNPDETWGSTLPKSTGRGRGSNADFWATLGNVFIGGTVLVQAPQKRVVVPQRAPGIGHTISAPTRAIDLNADGKMDLVNEKDGVLYYNAGDGKWIVSDIDGAIMVADLNGDDIQDFIFPGAKLQTSIYRGEGKFETQVLYENIQVDPRMYCYDFDKDHDVDILVTFSAPLNSTGYAYTMFFENDGTGRFTQLPEQDYGADQLLFSNCQDVDGDGYYDMLAFRGKLQTDGGTSVHCMRSADMDIVWLKGQSNKTFAQPEVLIKTPKYSEDESFFTYSVGDDNITISAEDIDNDGLMEVWVDFMIRKDTVHSGYSRTYYEKIPMYNFVGTSNTPPTAPQKPTLTYEEGFLVISWGDGSDAHTATADLTYALRVGTTPGGDDILKAHANAEGNRRNFVDGNMGKQHRYQLDLAYYQPSTIYVAVQAIDAQHVGSVWSEEASVEHTLFYADFSVSHTDIGIGQTLIAAAQSQLSEFTHTWNAEDGVVTGKGCEVQIIFQKSGTKTITHTVTAPDGTSNMAVEFVNVTPNYTDTSTFVMVDENIKNTYLKRRYELTTHIHNHKTKSRWFADYTMDGYWDMSGGDDNTTLDSYQGVVYKGSKDYTFERAAGIWNTGLSIDNSIWYDWDHNGVADMLFNTEEDDEECYYLPHNGNNNMLAKKEDVNLQPLFMQLDSEYSYYNPFVDFTHNGYYDIHARPCSPTTFTNHLLVRQADGTYQKQEIKSNADAEVLQSILGHTSYYEDNMPIYIDINRDGFTDACNFPIEKGAPYHQMMVLINKGNGEFEQTSIPFSESISSDNTAGKNDMLHYTLVDMDNDGYLDIVAMNDWGVIYIMRNEANQRFAKPEVLPLGELESFYYYQNPRNSRVYYTRGMYVVDIDNNGYHDIISLQCDKALGEEGYGAYVHYYGPTGVIQQGFITQPGIYEYNSALEVFKLPKHPWTIATHHAAESSENNIFVPIWGTTNECPSAPEGVRAVQTTDAILIEWNDAKDDFTPSVKMRYNLSVKRKGVTGAGAYIISPQNACNSNAAPLHNHDFITATQYIIPQSILPEGEYEIQVQAIDMQDDWSVFSEVVTFTVRRENVLEAPTVACLKEPITLVYMGAPSTSTPEWDFDGAEVVSGSGYGPYELKWDSVGTKTISLTIDGEIKTRMIYVEENDYIINFPTVVVDNVPITVNVPQGMYATYYLASGSMENRVYEPISQYPQIVTQKDNTLTFKAFYDSDLRGIGWAIGLTNENGCDTIAVDKHIYIVSKDDMPTISLVSANADGYNVINWSETSTFNFSEVRVLKETNYYNQFVEIGMVSTAEGQYVDLSSNAAVKSERYVIEPVMGEVELPMGTIHQTSHLTINRGINDQTWNLIWNRYEGAEVVSYNILRGTSPETLTQIASVSSNNTSYTDFAPDASTPYYAIEYVLADDVASAPRQQRVAKSVGSGRSNVVNSIGANTIVYANNLSIMSANNKEATSEDNPMLFLYAEIMPKSTTYQQVKWDIVSGEDLATINQNGLLTARTPNNGGTVIVKATTLDGTNISATRQFEITAVASEVQPTYFTVTFQDWDGTVLKTEQVEQGKSATAPADPTREGYTFKGWDKDFSNVQSDLTVTASYEQNVVEPTYFTVTFQDWDGTVLKTEQVEQGKSATAPADPTREGYTFKGWDKDFSNVQSDLIVTALYEQNAVEPTFFTVTFQDWDGAVLKTEQVEQGKSATAPADPTREGYTFKGWDKDFSNVQSDLIVTAQYEKNPESAVEDIKAQGHTIRKVIENQQLFIILPDGTRYSTMGQKCK